MKAIILVAGVSRRLFPRTREVPKCLLVVGGRTILDYQLSALEQAGIQDVVLVVGYRREQVMEAVQERYPPSAGWRITYVVNHHFFTPIRPIPSGWQVTGSWDRISCTSTVMCCFLQSS